MNILLFNMMFRFQNPNTNLCVMTTFLCYKGLRLEGWCFNVCHFYLHAYTSTIINNFAIDCNNIYGKHRLLSHHWNCKDLINIKRALILIYYINTDTKTNYNCFFYYMERNLCLLTDSNLIVRTVTCYMNGLILYVNWQ